MDLRQAALERHRLGTQEQQKKEQAAMVQLARDEAKDILQLLLTGVRGITEADIVQGNRQDGNRLRGKCTVGTGPDAVRLTRTQMGGNHNQRVVIIVCPFCGQDVLVKVDDYTLEQIGEALAWETAKEPHPSHMMNCPSWQPIAPAQEPKPKTTTEDVVLNFARALHLLLDEAGTLED